MMAFLPFVLHEDALKKPEFSPAFLVFLSYRLNTQHLIGLFNNLDRIVLFAAINLCCREFRNSFFSSCISNRGWLLFCDASRNWFRFRAIWLGSGEWFRLFSVSLVNGS
jgi:hypothetical protein